MRSISKSRPAASRWPSGDRNLLVQGDNLVSLKGLLDEGRERIRCIYIDPPYNNQETYSHYSDRRNHRDWLDHMRLRLPLLWEFLRSDGSIWISIDDREVHYLKVLCDSLFGRSTFISTIVWQHRRTRESRKVFSNNHEYILVYAKDPSVFRKSRNQLPPGEAQFARYANPDNDPRGRWQSVSANVQAGHAVPTQFYEIVSPAGKRFRPPPGRCWVYNEERMLREIRHGNIWFGRKGDGAPRLKKFLSERQIGLTPETLWKGDEVGTTQDAKKHTLELFPSRSPFDTPKPEALIKRILEIATDPGDRVLDCYLGSGTTVAVAHKMRRSYVGIEINPKAMKLCTERLDQVIAGESGGISEAVSWSGGGSYCLRRELLSQQQLNKAAG